MKNDQSLRELSICLAPLTNFFSGTERVVSDIGFALNENEIKFSLVLPKLQVLDPLVQTLQDKAENINWINSVAGRQAVGKNLRISYNILKDINPTFIHFHCPNYRWGLDVLLAAYLANIPVIRTEHNPLMSPPPAMIGLVLKILNKRTLKYIYVSEGNKQRFEHYLPHRIGKGVVVPNGIDPTVFKGKANTRSRVDLRKEFGFPEMSSVAIFVGVYGGRRPLRPIFEAFKQLLTNKATVEKAQQWRLLIVGSGDEEETRIVNELGIEPYVRFAGRRKDVHDILPNCDLFVTASEFEGMSISILEAWAVGLPILTTEIDGISDIIGFDEYKKFSIPIGDINKYATTWYKFMIKETDVTEINQIATKRVRRDFKIQNMTDNYLDLYASLIKRYSLASASNKLRQLTKTEASYPQKQERG